jgi:quinone-modifying oxidoreductase subunit QmoC
MPDRQLIRPDRKLIEDVMAEGGESLKKCFQCATCSGVCPLSPEDQPFPRKEVLWAQWGLKDRLVADPDVWRCYDCGDCSVRCPRGAQPNAIMATIRNICFQHYSVPGFLGRMVARPAWLPILFAVPVAILLLVLRHVGNLHVLPTGSIEFAKFLPHLYVDGLFIAVSVVVATALLVGATRMWKGMDRNVPHGPDYAKTGLVASAAATLGELLTHRKFNQCGANRSRFLGHLATFYGFAALFVVTAIVFVGLYLFELPLPLKLTNPIKVLANVGAFLLLLGCTIAILNRLVNKDMAGRSSYHDWLFLLVLFGVGLTGTLTEIMRLGGNAPAAYWLYFVHLVFVFFLIAYLPYSKFAHLVYRLVALVYAKYAGMPEPAPAGQASPTAA